MTYEEAIERLKAHFRIHDDKRPTPYLDEAEAMAYAAMEKQILKKPIYGDDKQDYIRCLNCNYPIATMKEDILNPYCPQCGQAIKWGE